MARWQDLRRAIRNKDAEGAERLWFELIEAGAEDVAPFLDAADLAARQPGGKRQAGVLLHLLVDALKERGRHAALLPVYAGIARQGSDDGTLRQSALEAVRLAHGDRKDLDTLIEQSGLMAPADSPAEAIDLLDRMLGIEPGAYVFHRSGWGVGKVVKTQPDRGRCVIDFRDRKGHEMDLQAAARLLERVSADDIRVQAMEDPKGLRDRARAEPLEVLRQALSRYSYGAHLKNLKEALVPDAVAPSRWSEWWKGAKKHALLDPRFVVGEGRDPKVEFHDIAQADFDQQIEQAMNRSATDLDRQNALRDMGNIVKDQPEAVAALAARAEKELQRSRRSQDRVGWILLEAHLTGGEPIQRLAGVLAEASDPVSIVRAIEDDATRRMAGEGLLASGPEGPDRVLELALEDDAVLAEVGAKGWQGTDHLQRLLAKVDEAPALLPNLYAWFLRGLKRNRFGATVEDAYRHAVRVLKVTDAVAYRLRRKSTPGDRKAVATLCDVLQAQDGAIVRGAATATDQDGARHLMVLLGQNRAFTPRLLEKLQEIVLRLHPTALRDRRGQGDGGQVGGHEIYMTEGGLERLQAELEQLRNVEMPANRAEIARAREFGDLKENAEYHAAREKQGLLEAKSRQLESDVARAKILTADIVRTDAVSVGSQVDVRDTDGHVRTYTLLGPPDADPGRGILNYQTPLAQALMGQSRGDSSRIEIDGSVREVEVVDIRNGLAG